MKPSQSARTERRPVAKRRPGTKARPDTKAAKSRPVVVQPATNPHVSIVGIGASAGGLEALDLFLQHTPAKSGAAFVVVQHLDPNHKGMLVELLQRATPMPVVQIKDRMKVEPDHVYVIPPNKDLSILRGALHLLEPAAPHGLRLPIDAFFRALAADEQEYSIGVILSGMGSDGSLGIRAIKEKAGAVFAQTPATAKFDGMPRSAVASGLVDVTASVEELPAKILAYRSRVPSAPRVELAENEQGALEKIIILLRAQTGHDFSQYKTATIYRRIERRMGLHQLARIHDYVRYLRENPREADVLFKELLIGVTSFFRDPAAWDQLRDRVLPTLFDARPHAHVFRAWVAGCSTGEEAYSLAILFKEAAENVKPPRALSLQIFATDLDEDAIDKARRGVYPANIAADVSDRRLSRFFVQDDHGYRVGKEIRETVIFATQNVVMDPPFTKLDVLTCRNLLIYMAPELQKKLVTLFHYALGPGGVLMLGSSETVGAGDLFTALPGKTRLYRRADHTPQQASAVDFPSTFGRPGSAPASRAKTFPPANLQLLADRLILQHYAPAVVLTGEKGDILYISGRTGKYIEAAAGQANWNLFAMARPGLSLALSEAFAKATKLGTSATAHGSRIRTSGAAHLVDITAQPLTEPAALHGTMLVLFTDVSTPAKPKATAKSKGRDGDTRANALEQELQRAHEGLQSLREEMQTSQEELKSANEELQSTNEELQSTNEELTTSKEEMQSMNEELQTVNHELQAKVDELSRANNDMKNLLNSTDIATLFLDDALNVRRFTSSTTSIIKLIPADVGRPITDLATQLNYPELAVDTQSVLRTLVPCEKQVATRDARWFTVRIMPYRTLENRIDGVVITFVDISAAKRFEADLRASEAKLREGSNTS